MTGSRPAFPLPAMLVAVPLAASLLVSVALSAGGALRLGRLAPAPPRNVAEALALGDAATAVWMFKTGADPAAVYLVRPNALNSELDPHVRPLAAAAYTSDDYMIRIALQYGATLPQDEARAAACWLARKGRPQMARLFMPQPWSPDDCPADGGGR